MYLLGQLPSYLMSLWVLEKIYYLSRLHANCQRKVVQSNLALKNCLIRNKLVLTLLDLSGEQLVHPGMDMVCIPSIFIKTSQFFFDESCLISAVTNFFGGKLRMLKVGPRGHWKRASIFQASHPNKKRMLPKANDHRK